MTSKKFITAEFVVALCGLANVVLILVDWQGDPTQVAALVFAALMCLLGLLAGASGLRLRRRQASSVDS